MNRLILVGNGFDLAHGLKTSYKDFIFWYLDSCFDSAGIYANGHFYEDDLVYIRVTEHYRVMNLANISRGKGISAYLYEKGMLQRYLDAELNEKLYRNIPKESSLYYEILNTLAHEVEIKSNFLNKLIFTCIDCGWVDIENAYFDELKSCKSEDGIFKNYNVELLNKEFSFLKGKLEEYLKLQQERADIKVIPELLSAIGYVFDIPDFEPFMGYENARLALGYDKTKVPERKDNLCFLNFNYTNTLAKYIEELEINRAKFYNIQVNHIHGELANDRNPIIFGFGDEHDKDYLTFEEQGSNDLFTHIKSYQYFNTANYRNLANFLNSDNYQVFIMGHSCGLSDRTMFKEIFDHENCKSVKIFHYESSPGVNDFWEKTVNLGRHFSDKGRMRKLIVEFDKANAFPQCN